MQPTTNPPRERSRRSDRYRQAAQPDSAAVQREPLATYTIPQRTQVRQSAAMPAPRAMQRITAAGPEDSPFSQPQHPDVMPHTAQSAYPPSRSREEPPIQRRVRQRRMLETPPDEMASRYAAEQLEAEREARRVPTWMSATIIVCILLGLGLCTASALLRASILTAERERQAAYQQTVNAHPLEYRALIERYAAEYNLQPAFVAAIILNESSFNPSAESRVGARGLMQLMPDTAQWIAHKLRLDSTYTAEQLWEPETNIRFGCWYLNYLSNLFYGDAVTVCSAYHAGQGEISSWLRNSAYAPNGRTLSLSSMPEGPTKIYAGRVNRDYGIYDALYFGAYNSVGAGAVRASGLDALEGSFGF
ncbi:MAG: transglycosylase SLT domain-containing protein [bacterium]|nr:transglycosylase SLT domain-containing protein [bacterium]